MEPRLIDAHCHLDLMAYPNTVADETAAIGLGVFDCRVDPRDFAAAKKRASRYPNIIAGIGLHPWWLVDGRCGTAEVGLLCKFASRERFIGEVGLDFSPRFTGTEGMQTQVFERLCQTLSQRPLPDRVLSIHAVRAAGTVLDVLESHGLLIPNPNSPLSSSTGLAVPRTNSSARAMRAVIFPSTNACSRLSEDANTYDRFHSTICCSRPMRQPKQIRKPQRDSSPTHSRELPKSSPNLKPAMRGASSRSS